METAQKGGMIAQGGDQSTESGSHTNRSTNLGKGGRTAQNEMGEIEKMDPRVEGQMEED